ncbi:GFA family protein [Aminobacter sp. MDW-2]|uniref:GFA family protein n=1 Tax=Aminobacter sp. MDW-2 TaxID=2666139 RepID=UPI0012AFC459|nr:GFA family protein [Aminobacter sp. MDW-2]MRX32039.1 GFA family protein [Aminobacter sp. MDW-2]QNH32502.1 GFA family protein [Aminobacter sp. MDW-2]
MVIKGSCHCKATMFEVTEVPETVTFCTCTFCSKRGALWAYYVPAKFKLTSPPENVSIYARDSSVVKHGFCASCGCGTFTETPDWSTGEADFDNPKVSVNARLFDDFDLDRIEVVVLDGKNLW